MRHESHFSEILRPLTVRKNTALEKAVILRVSPRVFRCAVAALNFAKVDRKILCDAKPLWLVLVVVLVAVTSHGGRATAANEGGVGHPGVNKSGSETILAVSLHRGVWLKFTLPLGGGRLTNPLGFIPLQFQLLSVRSLPILDVLQVCLELHNSLRKHACVFFGRRCNTS